ncbi:aldehyde dehydrogenase family protein [Actinomadura welshii]|uniref:aldehyde dehydrogenase family protein n=1 Tax=Actinomadura welshii TaxID=3103817 RepID=UPI0003AD3578|nr:aldehyde dehydrogenase family protein [Actinomadura madurae]
MTARPRPVRPAQLIDGVWAELDGTETPNDLVDRALAAAWRDHRAATGGLGSPEQRASALRAAADRLDELAPEIAGQDTGDSGVPISITRLFAGSLGDTLRGAADRIGALTPEDLGTDGRTVRLHRLPLGPAVVLAPWNAPTAVAAKKAAFAWAAGCPVIVKPSPWSPHGTTLLVAALHEAAEAAGLPTASIQLVFGGPGAGQRLVRSPLARAISFTGSRSGGRAVAAAAAGEVAAAQLELGSNNPAIVLDDADVARTAEALAAGMTKLNGAWCESPGTVFVPEELRDALVDALVDELGRLTLGDPFDEATTFGPQAFAEQAEEVRARVAEFSASGARVIEVGTAPPGGTWVVPTLVVDPPAGLGRAEVFGPVLVIRTCETREKVVDAAFHLDTGLAGYVFTTDAEAGQRIGAQLPVGEVKLNGTSLLDMSDRSAQAFWYGSGVGGHGDRELLLFFTGARIVGEDIADAPL